jgi:hypothetical protein
VKRTVLVGALLALLTLAIGGFEVADRAEASVEASVRRYAAAVTNSDLDAAMAEIAPDQRARWTDWVQGQLGNVYDVRGIAVRSPSMLERLTQHVPGGPREVTTALDVDRDFPDEFYQPTTRVDVEAFDGRWYLAAPLLATEP